MADKNTPWAILLGVFFLGFIVFSVFISLLPLVFLEVYVGMSAITFGFYGYDKRAAKTGEWRISEGTLHLFSSAGGWPGAIVGQVFFHHKTRKQPFKWLFWFTVVLNVVGFGMSFYNKFFGYFDEMASFWEFR